MEAGKGLRKGNEGAFDTTQHNIPEIDRSIADHTPQTKSERNARNEERHGRGNQSLLAAQKATEVGRKFTSATGTVS